MAILAGIDEAGFGPVLGPLVVSAAAFDVPDDRLDGCLWETLAGAVRRRPTRKRQGVAIADSKLLYGGARNGSLEHLERGVLSMLATRDGPTGSFVELLERIGPAAAKSMKGYAWYAEAQLDLPGSVTKTDVALCGRALGAAMERAGVRLLDLRCEPILVGEYNRMVEATDNKALTLLGVTGRLVDHVWRRTKGGPMRIVVDRQGGRSRYQPWLRQILPRTRLKIIDETSQRSTYRVEDGKRSAEMVFAVGAEEQCLASALASMASKYVRELFMSMLNRYWTSRVPGLTGTGGYFADGKRFLAAIRPAAEEMGVDERLLCRIR